MRRSGEMQIGLFVHQQTSKTTPTNEFLFVRQQNAGTYAQYHTATATLICLFA